MSKHRFLPVIAGFFLSVAFLSDAAAQNLFSPVARVNESVITRFEVDQRLQFLQALNAPGASPREVLDSLIEDRLRIQEASALGFEIGEESLAIGLEDFAGRANLSTEEFINALAAEGIARETFRDFVAVQITWRDLIRARFGSRVQISEAEIDRAIEASSTGGAALRVLLSEIIIPLRPGFEDEITALALDISQVTTEAEFSALAREYSATDTRDAGGRLDWVNIDQLPPALRPVLLSLSPGQVSQPLNIPDAVALFQLRDIEEIGSPSREFAAVEYAVYYIDGGRTPEGLARAETVREQVDVCDDLYGIAQGQPEEILERGALPPEEIPDDIALELAKMDANEVSLNLTRANGQTLVFLMLCGRTPVTEEELDRSVVRRELQQQRFAGFSRAYLEELRADAAIEVFDQ